MQRPEPVFEAPWHAQLFALTVHLNESGHVDWSEWATAFGRTLKAHGLHKELDGGEDYFRAWLDTLETLLAEKQLAQPGDIAALKAAWEAVYLSTPHGHPVRLAD